MGCLAVQESDTGSYSQKASLPVDAPPTAYTLPFSPTPDTAQTAVGIGALVVQGLTYALVLNLQDADHSEVPMLLTALTRQQ
jgi:hypothetical protein